MGSISHASRVSQPVTVLARLVERVRDLRDGLLSSPAFRRWAVAFPLTRPVARRRARALFDLCAGFVYSQVLLACVQLDLFRHLREAGPASAAALGPRLGLDEENTRRLLAAASSLDLVSRRPGDRYALGPLGATLCTEPGVVEMVKHHAMLYQDLHDPVALLRGNRGGGALASYWPYAESAQPADLDVSQVAPYSDLMAASQSFISQEVLDAYPVQRHRCLLDAGGGDGTFLTAAAARAPGLELMLFDLPPVVERARERLQAHGLAARSTLFGGDFRRDALPRGADLISLVRIIHDHDDASAMAILRAVRAALEPGGTLLLAEPMAGTPGARAVGDAYFGFYLLAMGSGRPRRPAELRRMLNAAGFGYVKSVPTYTPLLVKLMVAR